jgi:O-antigen ligase
LLATLGFLFLKISSIHEIVSSMLGTTVPVMYVLIPVAVGASILSGGLKRAFANKVGVLWVCFAVWLLIGVPFSSWPGGSLGSWTNFARTEVLIFFLLTGSVVTWKEYKRVMYTAGLALVVLILYAATHGGAGGGSGRLAFAFTGSVANPNDLAAHLLVFLPMIMFAILRPSTPTTLRFAGACFSMLALFLVLRTGSRGALIAIGVGMLMFLYRASVKQKLVAALVVPVAFMLSVVMLPADVVQRLQSFSSSSEDGVVEALQSSDSREYLLRKSIEFTMQYPVFGVGLGQFSSFEGQSSRDQGERGNWHETHNAYTQISSENGVTPLLLFLTIIVVTFRAFSRASARAKVAGDREMLLAATLATVGVSMLAAAIFFLSWGYLFYMPAFSGLAVVMLRLANSLPQPRRGVAQSGPSVGVGYNGGFPRPAAVPVAKSIR